jgi:hypothetical protein
VRRLSAGALAAFALAGAGCSAGTEPARVEPEPAPAGTAYFVGAGADGIGASLDLLGDDPVVRLVDAALAERGGLLREVVQRYDGLFDFELPYMMTVLEAPADAPDWHLAVEFLPPHRSAQLTKIRASVETSTGLFINDTLPEASARALATRPTGRRAEPAVPSIRHRAPMGLPEPIRLSGGEVR